MIYEISHNYMVKMKLFQIPNSFDLFSTVFVILLIQVIDHTYYCKLIMHQNFYAKLVI